MIQATQEVDDGAVIEETKKTLQKVVSEWGGGCLAALKAIAEGDEGRLPTHLGGLRGTHEMLELGLLKRTSSVLETPEYEPANEIVRKVILGAKIIIEFP
jgi:hypothetical protein